MEYKHINKLLYVYVYVSSYMKAHFQINFQLFALRENEIMLATTFDNSDF